MKEKLTIGKLAQKANVGVETVRFYERKGLIKQPSKQGGFRHYPEDYISRIKFIKRSQELGFTLNETSELLELKLDSSAKCSDVLERTQAKIDEVNEKIEDLKKMKKSLKRLAVCCEDTDVSLSECPILDHF
ncbi:MAG: MerR family DNA-binding protein [Bacteriovoracaceae bacterium]|nr:MerR family DNA-binding protein [Bacteriovoracaceae bacterium]